MPPSRIESFEALDGEGSEPSNRDGDARELRIETPRTARVAIRGGVWEKTEEVREVWYLLHGYAQTARTFLRHFRGFAVPGRLLVAPEALSRFYRPSRSEGGAARRGVGASWMTREDRDAEIRDYVRYLDRVAESVEEEGAAPRRLLLGFSQGAHTAARWAVLGRPRIDRLVIWGASLPEDLPKDAARRLREPELILVRGKTDGLRRKDEERRDEGWLHAAEVPYRLLTHAGGHEIVDGVLRTLAGGGE